MNDFCPFYDLENPAFSGFFDSGGGGGDSNAEAVLEVSVVNNLSLPVVCGVFLLLGSLRYGDYGLRTAAGRALSFVCSTGLSSANIER